MPFLHIERRRLRAPHGHTLGGRVMAANHGQHLTSHLLLAACRLQLPVKQGGSQQGRPLTMWAGPHFDEATCV